MNNMLPTPYLRNYSSAAARVLLKTLVPAWRQMALVYHRCLCIPAYAEDMPLQLVWQETQASERDLVMILGNWPESASAEKIMQTQQNFHALAAEYSQSSESLPLWQMITDGEQQLAVCLMQGTPNCLLIINQHGLPVKQGVGLARKILMDLAVGLYRHGLIESPWIGTTDADARLPADYWEQLTLNKPAGLLVFPFIHKTDVHDESDRQLMNAHKLYEYYLQQYKDALAQAFPAYAFDTLGSLYGVHAEAYEKVRGYPTRAAGEDFYLLNKMVKMARVQQLDSAPITLQARRSDRTPFGTGPSVNRLLAAKDMHAVPIFYAPKCLEIWQTALRSLYACQIEMKVNAHFTSWSELIPLRLRQSLAHQYKQCSTDAQRLHALHSIMDGLRCQQLLRQIHEPVSRISWLELQEYF